ncbi:hypothetical protein V6N11_001218 [Hibiscus sabdariffa]|uniref:RNase H type-1 domain-containing protein n=1 Tax=Hibiscus sabdariffa TaxID=183260 RepID=A0ABR2RZ28_9ROSI
MARGTQAQVWLLVEAWVVILSCGGASVLQRILARALAFKPSSSHEAFDIILSSQKTMSSTFPSILEMLACSWEIRFAFVCRESNVVAETMSRLVHPESLEYRR